jgi:hypothetical protein
MAGTFARSRPRCARARRSRALLIVLCRHGRHGAYAA